MTNDEVNEYIHVEIMGFVCWHEAAIRWRQTEPDYQCQMCIGGSHPQYTSDDSPRKLLDEVVAVVASPNSYAHFEDALFAIVIESHPKRDRKAYNNSYMTYLMINATAEQTARACVETHKTTV
jgi:hypothetical protein